MNNKNDETEESTLVVRPNKTRLKRESDALLKLGEELIALKLEELNTIQLPENLEVAITEARRIKSRIGSKRQRHYIGKLMRGIDHEEIARQLAKVQHKHDTNTASFKKIEELRDRLLSDGNDAITQVINIYPGIDRQHINQLVRQAIQEKKKEKPPAAARKLFKYLREIEENQTINH